MTPWRLILIAGLLVLAWRQCAQAPIEHGPGVRVASAPEQDPIRGPAPEFQVDDFTITAQAEFFIEARVLSVKDYVLGTEAQLSPIDLALGWGPMSDSAVLDQLDISQSGRFYWYRWSGQAPLPPDVIRDHSANMHMIPANSYVEKTLDAVRIGQTVRISGYLVNVDRADGWRWRSSLSRTDSGAGACELIWVESVVIEDA